MSKKIRYTNEPMKAKVIRDFLPPPEELVLRDEGVKVTISLSQRSVDFFKEAAERHHTSYQRMIRRLLDSYVDQYRDDPTKRSGGRAAGSRR